MFFIFQILHEEIQGIQKFTINFNFQIDALISVKHCHTTRQRSRQNQSTQGHSNLD